jgi:hypothetical protein
MREHCVTRKFPIPGDRRAKIRCSQQPRCLVQDLPVPVYCELQSLRIDGDRWRVVFQYFMLVGRKRFQFFEDGVKSSAPLYSGRIAGANQVVDRQRLTPLADLRDLDVEGALGFPPTKGMVRRHRGGHANEHETADLDPASQAHGLPFRENVPGCHIVRSYRRSMPPHKRGAPSPRRPTDPHPKR